MQSTCRGLVSNVSSDVEATELKELSRQMELASNISAACRRQMTLSYASVVDSRVVEDRTASGRPRPCTLDDYRARVTAFAGSYWARVDAAVFPAVVAHRRYVDRVGTTPPDPHDPGSNALRAAVWFDFARRLFNTSRRRLPWTRRRGRRRRRRQRLTSAVLNEDDYDDALVEFFTFVDVPDVDDVVTWKRRLRQRCVYRVAQMSRPLPNFQ